MGGVFRHKCYAVTDLRYRVTRLGGAGSPRYQTPKSRVRLGVNQAHLPSAQARKQALEKAFQSNKARAAKAALAAVRCQ